MRRLARSCHVLLLLLASALRAADPADAALTPEEINRGYRTHTLIAKPRAGGAATSIELAESAEQLRLVRAHPRLGGIRTLVLERDEEVKDVVARLAATGLYDYVEPDYVRVTHVVPNDTRYTADQWALNNTGQAGGTSGADIKAEAAWEIQREAPDVIVAVLDTGVRTAHADIAANIWRNSGEFGKRPSIDDDGNGYIDDESGIDATVNKGSFDAGSPADQNGHGTHVAGIIGAAGNNEQGITGVAWRVQIMPLKFIGATGGSVSAAVACLDYAIARGAHIINGSYGSLYPSLAEYDALKRARDAGIIFVASAGNDSQEINALPEYPAAYPLDNIVAVASTTRQDKLANYSTYGSGLVELAAPGSSILSLSLNGGVPYVALSGTSMAAPHVSGALALLKQKFPQDNYRALINRLLGGVDVLPALNNKVHTNGRLNLHRALTSTETRPFNDDFARRATITGEFNYARSSTQFATRETGEPDHGVATSGGSLWWTWTAPDATGKVTISTLGSGIDTVLAVYELPAGSTAPALASLRRVAANDDDGTATTSSATFEATAGASYAIAIAGKGGAEGLVWFSLTTVAVNDAFAQARPLSGPSVVLEAGNTLATAEAGEPKPKHATTGNALGRDHTLWFKWTAPATRAYQVSAFSNTMDPIVAVYTGNALGTLAQTAFDDDSGPLLNSLVRFQATAGVTYHICVDTATGSSGRFKLSLSDAAWQYSTDYWIYNTPAVAADGTLYFADGIGYVHAVNPDGTRKWRSALLGYVDGGAIAVGPDGTLYFGNYYGNIFALDPANGARKWTFQTKDSIWAAPALAADGTVYVKSDDGQLYAIAPDGAQKWTASVPGETYSGPVVAADGTIYIAAGGETALFALNPDGTRKWKADLAGTVYGSPAIGADGTIYVGNYDGRFFALRPDGTERWHFDTKSPLSGSAAIDASGTVYFGSYDKNLYALDGATGAKKWTYATGDIIRNTTPVLADDGTIYIGSDDGFVHAVSPGGTGIRTFATSEAIISSPVIAAGRLHVASADAKLYAFDIGANLARAPWPMHRQNLRRSARATELAGIPAFATQPNAPASVAAGTSVTLTSAAAISGGGAVSYQWYFNDAPIAGATAASYTISSAQGSHAGRYHVLATGSGGSTISRPTQLSVTAGDTSGARLINLAVRTMAGNGDNTLFVGFVVGGRGTSGNKPLLIRGVGPTLGVFGLSGVLADPKLQLFAGSTLVTENDDWAGSPALATTAAQVGAFGLSAATSKDAALLSNRPAGDYSAKLSTSTSDTGVALAEIYDATPSDAFTAATPRLINVSARTNVGTGGNILIAGFVIGGTNQKTVLIRAIGPTLGLFGVPGVISDPRLALYQGDTKLAENDNWGAASNATEVAKKSGDVGAFALALETKDAVLLVTLPPGSYTAQVSGTNNATGAALVEVYEVP